MVQISYQDLSKSDPNYYYIGIPKDSSGAGLSIRALLV
jgi:hypothetical protein